MIALRAPHALAASILLQATALTAIAQEPQPTIVVQGRADDLVGLAARASEGVVGQAELERRPLLRAGEVLETVPGVIVTQHSAPGKSNQQFARGVNLDHGTDLRTTLFGIPLNMPSHGHGQGYTDLGPLIPELVDTVRYRLGPYDARDGDFASVGAIDIDYRRSLERGLFQVTGGSYDFARTVVADSTRFANGELLAALELQSYDGPFDVDQDYRKRNGYLAWSNDSLRLQGFAYEGSWTATDQIPLRALDPNATPNGGLSRFASLDPTSGGQTRWFGISAEWQDRGGSGSGSAGVDTYRAYAQHYDFDLFSNFTYLLDDPVRGDQIGQRDRRITYGGSFAGERLLDLGAMPGELQYGLDLRGDRIHNGLFRTQQRRRIGTVRSDRIRQHRVGIYANLMVEPTEWFRSYLGGRIDHYWFDVQSDLASNSGRRDAGIASGKAGVAFGPFGATEFYGNVGNGFHSNDARGVLQRDDPATAAPNDSSPVTPLARSTGAEIGVRTSAIAGLRSTFALWALDLEQELVFVGDAGATEPTRASRRYGIEWANHYSPTSWLALDTDLTWARSRYRNAAGAGGNPSGNRIPGAVPLTLSAGAVIDWNDSLSTTIRVRHFDGRPLTEDGSVTSSSTTLVNARASYRFDERRSIQLDVLNLLDREASDIEYFYGSQLAGEANAVDDVHFHPVEPLSLRITFIARF